MCLITLDHSLDDLLYFVLFFYLWWLQQQLVEVRQVRLDGQQDAAVDGVASLEALSIHHAVHPVGGAVHGKCS